MYAKLGGLALVFYIACMILLWLLLEIATGLLFYNYAEFIPEQRKNT